MEIENVAHIGIAVKNLDEVTQFYRDTLGLTVTDVTTTPGNRMSFIQAGSTLIELIESNEPGNAIDKFIKARGEGIHHVALRVPDIAAAIEEAKAKGMEMIDQQPRLGAHNALIAFAHPRSSHGTLIEFWQAQEQ